MFKSRTATPVPPSPPPSVPELLTPPPAFNNLRLPKSLPDQDANLEALGRHFDGAQLELPVKEGEAGVKRALSEREKMFLRNIHTCTDRDDERLMIRYLTSTRGDLQAAIARLEKTLVWRRTEQIDEVEMLAAKYKEANKTGKGMVLGFSPRGEPVVYSFTHRNLTPAASRRGVDTTFMIERASDLMVDGVTEAIVIFYYGGERMGEPSNLSTSREMLSIMSDHYPYKLSLCAFQSLPWVVRTAMNVAWPFADAALKENVKFDKNLVKDGDVDRAVLMKPLGGDLDFTYDHDTYWDTLINTCLERRQDQLEKWRALGEAKTGREERLFKVRPTGHQ